MSTFNIPKEDWIYCRWNLWTSPSSFVFDSKRQVAKLQEFQLHGGKRRCTWVKELHWTLAFSGISRSLKHIEAVHHQSVMCLHRFCIPLCGSCGYIIQNLVCHIPIHSDSGRQSLSNSKDIFRAIFRIDADAKVRRPRFCQGVTGCDETSSWTSLYMFLSYFVILFGLSYSC